jgi:3-oxoadipate enol-lactonase
VETVINNMNVRYDLSGPEGAPMVMLCHSLSSSLEMWEPQMEALRSTYRVLRYDVRGHGGTDAPPGPYTLALLASDALELMDRLDIRTVHWVGISMGGMIGQHLGIYHGERIRSLCLCDTTAVIPDDAQPVWDERLANASEKGMPALVEDTLQRWFTGPFREQHPLEVEKIRTQILATPVTGYRGCAEAIRALNYLEELGRIDRPTLIMVGSEDPATTVDDAIVLNERIPRSSMIVLQDAAHLSNIEKAEDFNKALLTFLKKTEGS